MSARDELRDCFLSDSRDRFDTAADAYRAEVLAEAADQIDRVVAAEPGGRGTRGAWCRGLAYGAQLTRDLMATTAPSEKASADAPTATPEPLVVRWDRTVIPANPANPDDPDDPDDPTVVCCLTDDGRPVALLLDDELRGALGVSLMAPEIDEDEEATATPAGFFQAGHTYASGDGFTAPELIKVFDVEHVTRHREEGFLRAIGWMKSGAPGARWHGGFVDEDDCGLWSDITEGGAPHA